VSVPERRLTEWDERYAAPGFVYGTAPNDFLVEVAPTVARALRPGGALVLEAHTPRQREYGTGGPSRRELLMTLADARRELTGLEIVIGREREREVTEGRQHRGLGFVVQVLAVKPGA
jgi:hypothetical protein